MIGDSHPQHPGQAGTPKVAVIIPAYGVNEYIDDAVTSVLAQTYTDYELYVVNDGAPAEETAELKRILARYGSRVIYLERENGGQGAARNTAMRVTTAPYVAFLDGDDSWHPEMLEREVAVLDGDPSVMLVYSDARMFGQGPSVGLTYMQTDPSEGEVTLESLLGLRCNVTMSTIVARRAALIEAGWFDDRLRYVEDYELWLRMAHRGMRITYLRDVLAYRRLRESALSANALKLDRVLISVLDNFMRDHPLTAAERAAGEGTAAKIRSWIALADGKRSLSSGQFADASEALRAIRPEHVSWKLRAARFVLHTVPGALPFAYRWWTRFQTTRLRRLSATAVRHPSGTPAGRPGAEPRAGQ